MARALAEAGCDAVYSYAGRTANPPPQPLPTRSGGFGGVEGLTGYLRDQGISHVIDATHPFAAQISRNAVAACARAGVALIALERPAWQSQPGDSWLHVADFEAAAARLPGDGATVFLAIGRQNLAAFQDCRQRWLLRFAEVAAHPLHDATLIVSRGPYTAAGDKALMQRHGVAGVVAKNAGGRAAEAKLTAARDLGLPVLMIDRPVLPARRRAGTVKQVMGWLHGADPAPDADPGTDRGV